MLEASHSKTAFFKPALYYLNTENPRGATTLENSYVQNQQYCAKHRKSNKSRKVRPNQKTLIFVFMYF